MEEKILKKRKRIKANGLPNGISQPPSFNGSGLLVTIWVPGQGSKGSKKFSFKNYENFEDTLNKAKEWQAKELKKFEVSDQFELNFRMFFPDLDRELLEKTLTARLYSARGRVGDMKSKGRHQAAHCNLTLKYLIRLFFDQKGRCAISNILLTFSGDWRISIDRIDDHLGEVKGNVRLICHEFQCPNYFVKRKKRDEEKYNPWTPWTKDKFEEARALILESKDFYIEPQKAVEKQDPSLIQFAQCNNCLSFRRVDDFYKMDGLWHGLDIQCKQCYFELEQILVKPTTSLRKRLCIFPQEAVDTKDSTLIVEAQCTKCNTIKPKSEFRKGQGDSWHGMRAFCTECELGERFKPRQYLKRLLSNARANTKLKHHPKMTLTFEEIVDIYKSQRGRCFYSSIRLSFDDDTNWIVSLERLDNRKGYTRENCVLIVRELNVSRTQWSKNKVNFAWNISSLQN